MAFLEYDLFFCICVPFFLGHLLDMFLGLLLSVQIYLYITWINFDKIHKPLCDDEATVCKFFAFQYL